MKFKFPLQTVVKHRKIVEDLAQKDFLEVQAEFISEAEKLNEMQGELSKAHERVGELVRLGGPQGPALSQVAEFRRFQAVRIANQFTKVQEVEKRVEAKREILRQAAIEYKIIEKLKEKKLEEFKFDTERDEQKEMDEQSILRFKRNVEKR